MLAHFSPAPSYKELSRTEQEQEEQDYLWTFGTLKTQGDLMTGIVKKNSILLGNQFSILHVQHKYHFWVELAN